MQREVAQLTGQELFDLLSAGSKGLNLGGYYVSIDGDGCGGHYLWLTSPYGVDCGVLDFTPEKCAAVLDRIRSADPAGTERDPW